MNLKIKVKSNPRNDLLFDMNFNKKTFYYSIVIFLNKELKQYEESVRKGKECKISNLSVVIKLRVASGYYEGVVDLPEPDPLTSAVFSWP